MVGSLVARMSLAVFGWFVFELVSRRVGPLGNGWYFGCLVGCKVVCLVAGLPVARLVGWCVGESVGWLVGGWEG